MVHVGTAVAWKGSARRGHTRQAPLHIARLRQPLDACFVGSQPVRTLAIAGRKPPVGRGVQRCQCRRFVCGQPPVRTLVDRREPSRLQRALRLGLLGKLVFEQKLQFHSVIIAQGGVGRECRVAVAMQDGVEFGNHDLAPGRNIFAFCELGESLLYLGCLPLLERLRY